MDRRGGTSFAIFFILNPILILFFQNCSVVPHQPKNKSNQERTISSVSNTKSCRFLALYSCAE